MTLQDFASLSGPQNFRVVGENLIGIYKGFPFSLTLITKGSIDTVNVFFALDKNIPAKVRTAVKKALPKGAAVTSAVATQLIVICKAGDAMSAWDLTMRILEVATAEFDRAKKPLLPPKKCPLCRKESCESLALIGGRFVPVHRDCVVKQNQKTMSTAETNEEKGNYFLGPVGALLGALVASALIVALIFLTDREYGILYILIPTISYWGYRLLKGRNGPVARVVVILCTILAFAIMRPAIFHIFSLQEGYTDSFLFDFSYYYAVIPWGDKLAEAWFGLLFLIIGLGISFKMIGTTNADIINEASTNLESITNRDGSHVPVAGYELQRAKFDKQ